MADRSGRMNVYMVDFYAKPAHAAKHVGELFVRVRAENEIEAKKFARRQIQRENPALTLSEFELEVSAML